ncbi:MAG: carboxypeptidase-like regulatory domain-containing protein [Rhodothermales bacterium]
MSRVYTLRLPLAVLLFFSLALLKAEPAQGRQGVRVTVSGTVTDAETGVPLTGAHVFIASSMIGTTTDRDGRYVLDQVPLGAHRLYVSILGFEDDFMDILLRSEESQILDFSLTPALIDIGEIVVEAERDRRWARRLRRFTREFIGETPNAELTTILNPEVLDFEVSSGTFTARATAPLLIENKALGYQIQYFLSDFQSTPGRVRYDGEGLYEELPADNLEQAMAWEENRKAAFMGSFRHFMLALIAGRSESQGFRTFSRPSAGRVQGDAFAESSVISNQRFPIEPESLISSGEAPNEYVFDFTGHLEIVFMGEKEDPAYLDWSLRPERSNPRFQTSWTFLDHGPAMVDYKGDTMDPYAVVFMGYWAFERVADDPPREYRPGNASPR